MHDERTCVVPENIHTPSMEDHWKLRGRGGGFKGSNFRGVGRWESIFQRVTDHVQNTKRNV